MVAVWHCFFDVVFGCREIITYTMTHLKLFGGSWELCECEHLHMLAPHGLLLLSILMSYSQWIRFLLLSNQRRCALGYRFHAYFIIIRFRNVFSLSISHSLCTSHIFAISIGLGFCLHVSFHSDRFAGISASASHIQFNSNRTLEITTNKWNIRPISCAKSFSLCSYISKIIAPNMRDEMFQ